MARAKSGLTDKQERFIEEYLVDFNALQAAIRAGYSKDSAGAIGHENLNKPEISARIREAIEKRSKRTEITADNVLRELGRIVFSDIKDYLKFDNGEMVIKDSDDLTEDQSHCISEVTDSYYKEERKRSFKLHDKVKAIDMALRHLGLYLDKNEIKLQGKLTFDEIIDLAEQKKKEGKK